jgi:hypothetical protein
MGELALPQLAGRRVYAVGDLDAASLTAAGATVVVPEPGTDLATLQRNLDALLAADVLVVGPGAERSPETAVDVLTAQGAGLPVLPFGL